MGNKGGGDEGGNRPGRAVGPWHVLLVFLGLAAVMILAYRFHDLFKSTADIIAVISYVAAIVAAAFGMQIAVRGAVASAKNKVNAGLAQGVREDLAGLERELTTLSEGVIRLQGGPASSDNVPVACVDHEGLSKQVQTARYHLASARAVLGQIAMP